MLFPTAALQQSPVGAADSVVVASPLPGGIAAVVRFLLNVVPPWVQASGVLVALIAAAFALRWLILHRATVVPWLQARSRTLRWTTAAALGVVIIGAGAAGTATWDYVQHSNDFCTGCHVMDPAFERFASQENRHAELSCHACHQQSVLASARQLYLWVAERPERIGPHAKVANRVCEGCHVVGDTATWQHVATTAGHRVHLESDSSTLDDLQCVTCHGVEVHRFRPVKETCGQTDCHAPRETDIVLGRMAAQTVRHCTSCHPFTADVPALATTDSARGTLVPGESQCLGCHQMRRVLRHFVEAEDPHGGKCGTCHRPHTQRSPAAAAETCASAGCHADWRETPFHVGPSHRVRGAQCGTCHESHRAQVDASDCAGCHRRVRERSVLRPPVPFDTAAALRTFDRAPSPRPPPIPEGEPSPDLGFDAPTDVERPHGPFAADPLTPWTDAGRSQTAAARPDSFPHARHTTVACLECHQTGSGHGQLTFEAPRGCALCHHRSPETAVCATCHREDRYGTPKVESVTIAVPGRTGRVRRVEFLHSKHTAKQCVECHTTPVTLAPSPQTVTCQGCHADHHAPERDCATCHQLADPKAEHAGPDVAHQRCDACHTVSTIERLTPTRSLCITCHAPKAREHFEPRECTVCHFLSTPVQHRARLLTPRAP